LGKSPTSLRELLSRTVLKLWQGRHTVNRYELSPSNNFKSCGVVIPRRSSKRRSYRCRNSGGWVNRYITDAQQNVTGDGYDARDNRTSVIDLINGSSHPTTFAFDLMNRLTGVTYQDGSTVGFTYDVRGRRITSTEQNNQRWPESTLSAGDR
jgi:YD repeat-containing protein